MEFTRQITNYVCYPECPWLVTRPKELCRSNFRSSSREAGSTLGKRLGSLFRREFSLRTNPQFSLGLPSNSTFAVEAISTWYSPSYSLCFFDFDPFFLIAANWTHYHRIWTGIHFNYLQLSSSELESGVPPWPLGLGPRDLRPFRIISGFLSAKTILICFNLYQILFQRQCLWFIPLSQ